MIKSYMQKNKIITLFLSSFLFIFPFSLSAADNLALRLSGKILLEVQSHGEAWYVYPTDQKRYFLGRPNDAFDLMKKLGLGTTHQYIISYTNKPFPKNISGKILLDVEDSGRAYYINPSDMKGYYLGRPSDAFDLMKKLGLGITNENLNKIFLGEIKDNSNNPNPTPTTTHEAADVIKNAADAIRKKDKLSASSYFVPEMKNKVQYAVEHMSGESLLLLGNILSGSTLKSQTDSELIYKNDVYFSLGGYTVPLEFHVKKQSDGKWLMTNL